MTNKYQRRHYEDVAAILKQTAAEQAGHNPGIVVQLAQRFANTFEQDNPRFDRTRFFTACGVWPIIEDGEIIGYYTANPVKK